MANHQILRCRPWSLEDSEGLLGGEVTELLVEIPGADAGRTPVVAPSSRSIYVSMVRGREPLMFKAR